MGLIPEWYDQNISSAVLLGPCDCPNAVWFAPVYSQRAWEFLDANQIWVLANTAGYDWNEKKQVILNSGIPELVEALPSLEGLPNNPTQALAAYAQTSLTYRFQNYMPDYLFVENPKSPILDYGMVKEMKVNLFVGLWDYTCPMKRAQEIYENLGGEKTVYKYMVHPIEGHVSWGFTGTPWFMDKLEDALMHNADI